MNGAFSLPSGDVQFKRNGKWESFAMSDGETEESIREMNDHNWKFPKGTECRYLYRGKLLEFTI